MRSVAVLSGAAVSAAVLTACNGGATEPPFLREISPTPATETPTPTPIPETVDIDGFRAFAALIDQALAGEDAGFFADRGLEEEMTCAGDEQLGPCAGQSAGTVLRGIPSAVAQTDRFALLTPDEYTSVIGAWFADARPELSDEYGSGVPGLFALAYGPADRYGEDVYLAILTGIFTSQTADLRQARILSFQLLDGSWRLTQDMFVPGSLPAGGGADDFLSGECDFCYDHWERWEGTP